jgi:hypothetical protein
MNLFRLMWISLGLGLAGLAYGDEPIVPPTTAVSTTNHSAIGSRAASLMPPVPQIPSPVAMFRRLLGMTVPERESFLNTNRAPEMRAALRAKIKEYLAMDPDDRELRLRATELRWQLIPLLRTAPADRGPRLALVPDDLAPLVKSRLAEWDQLPPSLQQEFLANDHTLHYFAHVETTNNTDADSAAAVQREKIARQFDQFFELTPEEKQKTLKTLSTTERAQMEQTLQAFTKLTGTQRIQCMRAFTQFAELKPAERAEFLKNAERWAQMSPKERQTWRDLVARVPKWPPVPSHIANLMPPPPGRPRANMATN